MKGIAISVNMPYFVTRWRSYMTNRGFVGRRPIIRRAPGMGYFSV